MRQLKMSIRINMKILFFEDLLKKEFNKTIIFNEIVKLEEEFFPKYHYNLKDIQKFYRQSKGYTLILLDKNKIAGYLIPILFKNKDYLQLLTIAVSKKYQKRGYGTKMLKRCEEIAKMLQLQRIITRAEVSYPILKTLKNLKYIPMKLKDINAFMKEGVF